jgi:hypothetical protein
LRRLLTAGCVGFSGSRTIPVPFLSALPIPALVARTLLTRLALLTRLTCLALFTAFITCTLFAPHVFPTRLTLFT